MSAAPALSTVSAYAERDGMPHGKIISTTPSDLDSPSGIECKVLIDNACVFLEQMFDWPRHKVKEFINANSSNGFLYIKYTWQQLGLPRSWYEQQCKDLLQDRLAIRREVDLEWTKASDNSVFDEEELDILAEYGLPSTGTKIVEVDKISVDDGIKRKIPYAISLFGIEELDKDKIYFVGCDVGGGFGRDSSTIVITDPTDNYKEVAIFKNNLINTKNYSELLIELIRSVIPKAILFIENNSYGSAVIDNLLDNPVTSRSVYFEYLIQDKDKTKPNPKKVTNSIRYGINTNVSTRELMIDLLRELVTEYPERVCSDTIYLEIRGLIITKSGKVEHSATSHDDCVMGKLMVLYAVAYGNNMAKHLRSVEESKRINRKVRALSSINNPLNKNVFDPAKDTGANIDFNYLKRAVESGEDPRKVLEELMHKTSNKPKREINQSALLELQSNRKHR